MPAYLIEPSDEVTGEDILGNAPPSTPAAKPAEAVLDGEDIPEKYRGKTAKELLAIAREQETYIGRLGQEKGELRSRIGTLEGLVDKALKLRDPGLAHQPAPKEDDLLDFSRKPQEAVSTVVQKELEPIKGELETLTAQARARAFEERHPTAAQDLNDERFVEFVKKYPRRAALAQKAFGNPDRYDFEAAEQLWEEWEDVKSALPTPSPAQSETPTNPGNASAATGETPPALIPAGNGGSGSGSSTGKPLYSRSQLERLQVTKPDQYWAPDVQARISEAYREGRVLEDNDPRLRGRR